MSDEKEKLTIGYDDPDATPGIICKSANVSPLAVTDADLRKINKYTLSPVTADEVYTFKAVIADNEQDDRKHMPFNLKSLQDMNKLYPGKTMIKDHINRADNQIGRIYDTELVQDANKTTELGELHTELVAKIYMIRTDSNKDLIAEIAGGIKKEVSTSTVPEKMICSVCGTDNRKDYCRHYPGFDYETTDAATGKTSKKRCKMLLSGIKDAYELSFVTTPAQPRAGTHKSAGFAKPVKEKQIETPDVENNTKESEKDDTNLKARVKFAESFFYVEKESEEITNE